MKRELESTGIMIKKTASLLRNYALVERRGIRLLSGWFLATPAYEVKYRLAYHALDHADHVTALRQRLAEMRGGQPDAAVSPALKHLMEEALHAPSVESFLRGYYGVILRDLLRSYREHLKKADASANAVEVRLLRRMIPEVEAAVHWYEGLALEEVSDPWQEYLRGLLSACGGVDESMAPTEPPAPVRSPRFERPKTVILDQRVQRGEFPPFSARSEMTERQKVVEQFKLFFNEVYAASLLATILFDAFEGDYPWEMFADFTRHFWDEARHSEFGMLRLRELGEEPSIHNPELLENSEGMPVVNRICYLTRGLESFFMPRKQPRIREYEALGDLRSQLFADQDWSDEISHVRYGSVWCDHLLKDDFRDIDDILEECRQHLERVTGKPQDKIAAPF